MDPEQAQVYQEFEALGVARVRRGLQAFGPRPKDHPGLCWCFLSAAEPEPTLKLVRTLAGSNAPWYLPPLVERLFEGWKGAGRREESRPRLKAYAEAWLALRTP